MENTNEEKWDITRVKKNIQLNYVTYCKNCFRETDITVRTVRNTERMNTQPDLINLKAGELGVNNHFD